MGANMAKSISINPSTSFNLTGTGVLAIGAVVAIGAAVAYYLLNQQSVNAAAVTFLNTNPISRSGEGTAVQVSTALMSGNPAFLTAPVNYNLTSGQIQSQVTGNPSQSEIYINTTSTGATQSIGTYNALPTNIYQMNQAGVSGSINAPFYIGNGWQGAGYYASNANGTGVIKLFTSQLNFMLGISS